MDSLDIVVFSDSHGNSARMRDIIDGTGADVVIHLGDGANDIESIEKTDRRRRLYIYVRGNCDFFSSDLPYTREFTLLGRKFLILHGHTAGVKHGTAALEAIASDRGADIVMYGHTHEPDDRFIPGEDGKIPLRILNPGSIGDRIRPTYATVTLRGQDILTNICDYEGEY